MILDFGQRACEQTRRSLDGYLSGELEPDAQLRVTQHLRGCVPCRERLEHRCRARTHLQRAANTDVPTTELRQRVERELRASRHDKNWMLGAAAAVIIGILGYAGAQKWSNSGADSLPIMAALKVGVDDHIHCAQGSWYRGREFSDLEMAEKLGAQYAGLAPLVRAHMPEDARLVVAHQCRLNGRSFVHLILKRADRTISLIVTAKQGETVEIGVAGKMRQDTTLSEATIENLQVAGFETRNHWVYVVSDSSRTQNQSLAVQIAPRVREYISRLES